MKSINFLLLVLCLYLNGCYSILRTAEILKEKENAVDIQCTFLSPVSLPIPKLHYRRGVGNNSEMGLALYYTGIEVTACKRLLKEGKRKPAIAVEGGIGTIGYYPALFELNVVTSKRFGSFVPYLGGKFLWIHEIQKVKGICGGIALSSILFIEFGYNDFYTCDFLEGGGWDRTYMWTYGLGLSWKFGG